MNPDADRLRAILIRPTTEARAGYTAKGRAQVRDCPQLQRREIEFAMAYLRAARDCLTLADAPRTLARVRAALKSADGARRHANLAPYREARQARS